MFTVPRLNRPAHPAVSRVFRIPTDRKVSCHFPLEGPSTCSGDRRRRRSRLGRSQQPPALTSPTDHRAPLAVQQVNLVSDEPGKAALQRFRPGQPVGPLAQRDLATVGVQPGHVVLHAVLVRPGLDHRDQGAHRPGDRAGPDRPGQRTPAPVSCSATAPTTAPARFIFATLTGQIAAWGPPVTPMIGAAADQGHHPRRVLHRTRDRDRPSRRPVVRRQLRAGPDRRLRQRVQAGEAAAMGVPGPHLPKGYAPFNVQTLNGKIFVAYAKVDPKTGRNASRARASASSTSTPWTASSSPGSPPAAP